MSPIGVAIALILCGCSQDTDPDRLLVYPASGTVLIDGEPAEDVSVVLKPMGASARRDAPQSTATTSADGTFSLTTYVTGDGAPAGEYAVVLYKMESPEPKGRNQKSMPGMTPPVDVFRGRYSDPSRSPWTITIGESENQLEPLEATSR